tara:strand:- start:291 stop:419 length:129 start_codon:yes stop_codon:yes gene_type:complete
MTEDFTEIIRHLLQENKELKERLNLMEEILHSYLPVIGENDE